MSFPWSYTEGFVLGDLPMAPVSGLWTTPKLNTQQHSQASARNSKLLSEAGWVLCHCM